MLAIHDAVMIHFETPTMFAKQLDAIRETGKCTVFYLHLLVSLGVLSVLECSLLLTTMTTSFCFYRARPTNHLAVAVGCNCVDGGSAAFCCCIWVPKLNGRS